MASGQGATRVIVVRHGETAWNVDTRIQGQLDIGLNDTGRWQAERLARALEGEGIEALYASDLSRAFATAEALGRVIGLPVQPDTGLRERHFGIFQGRTWGEIAEHHPAESERWRKRDPAFGPAGGETLQAFYDRVLAAASRLVAPHAGQTVALVAHGGVLDCLYRAATRVALDAPRTWQLGNASINRLLHSGEGFTLVGWSDTSHLDDAHGASRDDAGDSARSLPGDPVGPAA